MVKKYEEFINEIRFREVDDDGNDIKVEVRKENGVQVTTSLGIPIVVSSRDCNYEKMIEDIFDEKGYLDIDYLFNFPSSDYRKEIMNGTSEYSHNISDGSTNLVASYPSYEDLKDNYTESYMNMLNMSKEDYLNIIRSISEKLKTVEIASSGRGNLYETDMCLLLKSESEMYYHICEFDDDNYYIETLYDNIHELLWDEFAVETVTWTFNNYAPAVGLNIGYHEVKNYEKILKRLNDYLDANLENYKNDNDEEV